MVCRLQLEAVFATALHSWKANPLWTFDWRMTAWGGMGVGGGGKGGVERFYLFLPDAGAGIFLSRTPADSQDGIEGSPHLHHFQWLSSAH